MTNCREDLELKINKGAYDILIQLVNHIPLLTNFFSIGDIESETFPYIDFAYDIIIIVLVLIVMTLSWIYTDPMTLMRKIMSGHALIGTDEMKKTLNILLWILLVMILFGILAFTSKMLQNIKNYQLFKSYAL